MLSFPPLVHALPLLLATAVVYAATLGAAAAGRASGRGPFLAMLLPGAAAALAAAAVPGHADAAIHLLLATAVAAVTLVLGMALLAQSEPDVEAAPETGSLQAAVVGLVLAGGVLLLLGFTGTLGWIELLLMLGVGAAAGIIGGIGKRQGTELRVHFWLLAAGAVAASVAGLWLAYTGLDGVTSDGGSAGQGFVSIAATVLAAPMLALPAIGVATRAVVRQDRYGVAVQVVGAAVWLALPVLAAVLVVAATASAQSNGWTPDAFAVALPPRAWRVDGAVLAVAGLLLLPAAAGWWRPGRIEGIGLLVLYAGYLVASVVAAR
jgi:hypothetical protein